MDGDAIDVGGRPLVVRTMDPCFGEALVAFHDGLSAATVRNRFFTLHPHLSAAEVVRFCGVDHVDREAYAVFDGAEIVAVARFDRLGPGAARAEAAFVVADAWQHHGLGAALLVRLAARARELGITELVAETLVTNAAMQAVFRNSGLPCTTHFEDGVVQLSVVV